MDNWMLISIALASGGMLLWPTFSGGMQANALNPTGAVQLINREKATVVDVSTADVFAAGHVGGAKNIPFADLESKLPLVIKNKALPLILVCGNGSHARRAVAVAQKLGYTQAQALAGGLKAWKEASLPFDKTA